MIYLNTFTVHHLATIYSRHLCHFQVYAFADRMYSEGKRPDPDLVLDEHALSRSRWLTREELEKRFLEKVKEHQYQEVIKVKKNRCQRQETKFGDCACAMELHELCL